MTIDHIIISIGTLGVIGICFYYMYKDDYNDKFKF